MSNVIKYRIVFEGEYEVNLCDYDTDDMNEIAVEEREFAHSDALTYLDSQTGCVPTEILILPK
jgi:hypothetical protein